MSQPSETAVVGVALIENAQRELLWVWDDDWGCFALPMSRTRWGDDVERPDQAAARAGARALGVPVTVGVQAALMPRPFVSGRDRKWRQYRYHVCKVQPHPDFASQVATAGPHFWLPPHRALREGCRPFSDSGRWIVATLAEKGWVSGRSQYTGVVVLRRKHANKWQFLLRLEPAYGYALPTKRRREGESYLNAARRVLTDELGLTADAVPLQSAAEAVVSGWGRSKSEETETFYSHGVFTAEVPESTKFTSGQPLVWADGTAIAAGTLTGRVATTGAPAPDGKVSSTALHILDEEDFVPILEAA